MKSFIDDMKQKGFDEIPLYHKGVQAVYNLVHKEPHVLCFVDCDEMDENDATSLEDLDRQIKRFLMGISYDSFRILMLVSSADINAARKRCMGYGGFWLINKETRKLIIYENQPADYLKIRNRLEVYLETGMLDGATVKTEMKKQKAEAKNKTVSMDGYKRKKRKYSDITRYLTISNIIIAVNIIVYMILASGGDMEDTIYIHAKGGLSAYDIQARQEYYRFFTSMFLHFGAFHLMNNVMFIFCFGNTTESVIGKLWLGVVYILSGLGGGIAEYFVKLVDEPFTVAAGASGAAYGLFGALIALAFLDNTMRYRYNLKFLLGVSILFIINDMTRKNVAVGAHIGGFITGLLVTGIIVAIRNRIRRK